MLADSCIALISAILPFALRDNEPEFIRIDLTNKNVGQSIWKLNKSNTVWTVFQKGNKYTDIRYIENGSSSTNTEIINGSTWCPMISDSENKYSKKEFYEAVCKQAKRQHRFFEIIDGQKSNLYAEYI